MKQSGSEGKSIFKEAMRGVLPDEVTSIYRPEEADLPGGAAVPLAAARAARQGRRYPECGGIAPARIFDPAAVQAR